MPDQVQLRGGTEAENNNFTGVSREVTVDTTNKTLRVHDGVASGGHPLIQGTASTAADADTIALRDEWGRLQVADPQDAQDAASKGYVDGVVEGSHVIRQIVRATDSTLRSTASTTWVDVPGMSVTITPRRSDTSVIVVASFNVSGSYAASVQGGAYFQLVDSNNNTLSGAEHGWVRVQYSTASVMLQSNQTIIGYVLPGITDPVTYKMRFYSQNSYYTVQVNNDVRSGQMYAIEVSM